MIRASTTEFLKNFGHYSTAAQNEPIAITNHGRITGYYLTPHEYETLLQAQQHSYRSMRYEIQYKRHDIVALAKTYGAKRIRLFGSVARGEDRLDSDIDFLVDFPENYSMFDQRLELQEQLEALLGRKIDLVVEHEMNTHMAPYILAGAIDL